MQSADLAQTVVAGSGFTVTVGVIQANPEGHRNIRVREWSSERNARTVAQTDTATVEVIERAVVNVSNAVDSLDKDMQRAIAHLRTELAEVKALVRRKRDEPAKEAEAVIVSDASNSPYTSTSRLQVSRGVTPPSRSSSALRSRGGLLERGAACRRTSFWMTRLIGMPTQEPG